MQFDLALISEESAGRTAEAFDKITQELPFKFRQLKQDIVATFRGLGEPLLRPVELAFKIIRVRLQAAQGWFTDNQDAIESWATAAVIRINDVINQLSTWFDMLKGGEAEAAFKEMGEAIKRNLTPVFQFMRDKLFPIAAELGLAIGNAIVAGVRASIPTVTQGLNSITVPSPVGDGRIPVFNIPRGGGGGVSDPLVLLRKIEQNTNPLNESVR